LRNVAEMELKISTKRRFMLQWPAKFLKVKTVATIYFMKKIVVVHRGKVIIIIKYYRLSHDVVT